MAERNITPTAPQRLRIRPARMKTADGIVLGEILAQAAFPAGHEQTYTPGRETHKSMGDGRLVPGVRRVDGVLEAAAVTTTLIARHLEGTVRLASREQHPARTRCTTAGDVHGGGGGGGGEARSRRCSVTRSRAATQFGGFAVLPSALADADAFEHTLTLSTFGKLH
ncbi:hypothetical protein GGX14DRAFT_660017 [Mycena pura]|uniref:Uncharacterized protein n=1 Tax=Mycena pura TaxID=153505 RepID=A0AAD6V686_9AGAR|nr:hypothetical protein GGX14DRAFT_660017 [Mycena pura]